VSGFRAFFHFLASTFFLDTAGEGFLVFRFVFGAFVGSFLFQLAQMVISNLVGGLAAWLGRQISSKSKVESSLFLKNLRKQEIKV